MPRGEHLKGKGGPGRPKGCKDKKPRATKRKRKLKTKITFVKESVKQTEVAHFKAYLDSLPPPRDDVIVPASEIRISTCCATCRHFMPIARATGYNKGYCTFGRKDLVASGIRIKYEPVKGIVGSLPDVLEKMRQHYPEVHSYFTCDNYQKTTKISRLKNLLKAFKRLQDRIIWESELKI